MVVGTRKFHQVLNYGVQQGSLKFRNLSCFCNGCESDTATCLNESYVNPYVQKVVIVNTVEEETRKRRRRKNAEVERSEVSESEPEELGVSKRKRRRRQNAEVKRAEVSESEPGVSAPELDVSKRKGSRRKNAEVERSEVSESETEELDVSNRKRRRRQNAEVKRPEVSESEPGVSAPELDASKRKGSRRKNAEVERSETEELDVFKRKRRRRKNAEVERSEVSESEPEELDVSKRKRRRRQNAEVKRPEVSESDPEVSVPEPNILVTDSNEHDGRLIKEVDCTIVESAWRKLESCTTFDDIQIKITEFATEFPPILKLPKVTFISHGLIMDNSALKLLPADYQIKALYPARVYADGNCLPRTASVLVYGIEDRHLEMRVRIIKELVESEEKYLSDAYLATGANADVNGSIVKTWQMFSEQYRDQKLTPTTIRRIYRAEVLGLCSKNSYMGIWQIAALSNNLNTVIISVYPEYGGSTVRIDLHRKFIPYRLASKTRPETVHIMWSNVLGTDIPELQWRPNHFVPLLEMLQEETNEEFSFEIEDTSDSMTMITDLLGCLYDPDIHGEESRGSAEVRKSDEDDSRLSPEIPFQQSAVDVSDSPERIFPDILCELTKRDETGPTESFPVDQLQAQDLSPLLPGSPFSVSSVDPQIQNQSYSSGTFIAVLHGSNIIPAVVSHEIEIGF
ncbi:uncharacterized protein LOC134254137 [Saccostrea cucullata]|uniref:uncharacterized protein LOC134254137 n=1 Tax=Saccostrea cuccullata TaxID=36930 RepID=UPI002ED2E3FD